MGKGIDMAREGSPVHAAVLGWPFERRCLVVKLLGGNPGPTGFLFYWDYEVVGVWDNNCGGIIMDKQKVKEQLQKLESKAEPWLDRQVERLAASKWTARIVGAVVLLLIVVVALLLINTPR